MEPLTKWTCDVCGNLIETADEGYVVWRRVGPDEKEGDYKIIHQSKCDPGSKDFTFSLPLESLLGEDGLAHLLSWLSPGPIQGPSDSWPEVQDFDEYVDLVRRLHTPYYEEARTRFSNEEVESRLADSNPYAPYLPETLRRIAEESSEPG